MNNLDFLDALNLFSVFLGIANYQENLSQSVFQQEMQKQSEDLHTHLKEQDEKINIILERLQNENN